MSDAERLVREWRFYVDDMIGFFREGAFLHEGHGPGRVHS